MRCATTYGGIYSSPTVKDRIISCVSLPCQVVFSLLISYLILSQICTGFIIINSSGTRCLLCSFHSAYRAEYAKRRSAPFSISQIIRGIAGKTRNTVFAHKMLFFRQKRLLAYSNAPIYQRALLSFT